MTNMTTDNTTPSIEGVDFDYLIPPNTLYFFNFLGRIATASETIAANSTSIKNNIELIKQYQQTISSELTTIDNHLDRMQSVIREVNTLESDAFLSGPHVRNIGASWDHGLYGYSAIARAMMMMNLKETNKLDVLKKELSNPTPLP